MRARKQLVALRTAKSVRDLQQNVARTEMDLAGANLRNAEAHLADSIQAADLDIKLWSETLNAATLDVQACQLCSASAARSLGTVGLKQAERDRRLSETHQAQATWRDALKQADSLSVPLERARRAHMKHRDEQQLSAAADTFLARAWSR